MFPLFAGAASRYSSPMAERFHCAVCDQVEYACQCDKYCVICQGFHQVRLCEDGQHYCLECREACDYVPERD
jgi:hypothetical protein